MNYLFQEDECQILIMAMSMSAAPPKREKKTGALIFAEPASLEVRARRYHEAVDATGAVIGTGTWFHAYADKGSKITIRKIEPPRKDYSASEIKQARRKMTVRVVDQERHDAGPFNFGASYEDGTLAAIIKSLTEIRDSIPEEYRDKARCEIDSESGYEGSHYAHIKVSYERPETDGEVVTRLQDEAVAAMLKEREERAKLAALQKKFAAA